MELIDIPKEDQLKSGFERTKGGRIVYVCTDYGDKPLFLPTELNSDFEDDFYHGYIIGEDK